MRKPRVTVLFDSDTPVAKEPDFSRHLESKDKAEYHVARTLEKLGYRFSLVGHYDNIRQLVRDLYRSRGKVAFNMSESWLGDSGMDYTIASLLELMGLPYTGSPPFALQLARDKAVSKKILDFHRIRVPEFAVFHRGQERLRPSELRFPLIVKPLLEDASLGIAQSSVVHDDRTLLERVMFIHEHLLNDAIVEELIFGREIYLAVLGNDPPKPLTLIEMVFKKEEDEELKIATYRAKWSAKYRKDKGIQNVPAKRIRGKLLEKIRNVGLTTYEMLQLRDYARIDMRLTPDNEVYVIEANPNPFIAPGEDVPLAAAHNGINYEELVETILKCAIKRGKK
ncbi:MAG: D-alanine--D-alanine ligase family protein [Planctomycetota bacterium]|jgi:D-alanine-D-alanine ligase